MATKIVSEVSFSVVCFIPQKLADKLVVVCLSKRENNEAVTNIIKRSVFFLSFSLSLFGL